MAANPSGPDGLPPGMGLLERLFGGGAPKAMPVPVDDSNFEDEVLRSHLPVVLDV